ncbi:MAG TPA: MFS transporter [Pyrinomonadaceae bacterium]|nr:MFS transporter [Pyrinomonadaceae bacterium]
MPALVEPNPAHATRSSEMFRALTHRNFRLFWAGAFLSNIGTWMQTVAQGWLVLQLTDSAFWLGVDGFAATSPGLVLTLLGGVYADRIDRKRLLIITQAGAGLTALALALLIATGIVNDAADVWIILVASFITGCCFSLASPSYQAITIDLVGREDLSNAIALNSTQFQLSRVVGPALAGVGFQLFGLAGCFFVNGLSFVAIIIALSLMRLEPRAGTQKTERMAGAGVEQRTMWRDLMNGFRYVWSRPRVFLLLLISAVASLFGAPYMTLMPLFTRDVLGLGETGLSVMMGVAGAGSFFAALMLTFLGNIRRKGRYVLGGSAAFGLCLVGFSLSTNVTLSLVMLFGIGFSIVCSIAVTNMLLQKLVTDEMRGRVMSMFMLSFIGAWPIGSFLAGVAARRYGAPHTLAAGGVIIALFNLYVAIRNPRLRTLD